MAKTIQEIRQGPDVLRKVEGEMQDRDSTSDDQVEAMMHKYFPEQYVGIFSKNNIPHLQEGQIALVFDGPASMGHWRAVYKLRGKLYEYDSYKRDVQGSRYIDANSGKAQGGSDTNCGQRTIAHLLKVFNKI
jgi:hypothetical protein